MASLERSSAHASTDQIDGWIDAATLTLTAEDLRDIVVAITQTEAGRGPEAPASLAA